MSGPGESDSSEKDWRLQAQLDVEAPRERLREVLGALRGPHVLDDVRQSVGEEVVVTHDDDVLYAYAASEAAIGAARRAIDVVLARDTIAAQVRVSHWDAEHEEWRQVDPPPSEAARELLEREDSQSAQTDTRTLVATAGRLVRSDFEQSMRAWAQKLGLQCEIVEHPHLLTTQLAFTVTGPKERVQEFADGLKAEGWQYVRTETQVMLNPL